MDTREALEWERTVAQRELGWAIGDVAHGGPDRCAEKRAALWEIEMRLSQLQPKEA